MWIVALRKDRTAASPAHTADGPERPGTSLGRRVPGGRYGAKYWAGADTPAGS